jgi:DNA-binding NarL/FixJ family response regulator
MTPSIALKALKLLRDPELIQNMNQEKEDYKLSAREIEILDQISTGLKYNKIAENLFLSVNTVRKHVVNIYEKLQVHNKLEAVQKAKNNRLI